MRKPCFHCEFRIIGLSTLPALHYFLLFVMTIHSPVARKGASHLVGLSILTLLVLSHGCVHKPIPKEEDTVEPTEVVEESLFENKIIIGEIEWIHLVQTGQVLQARIDLHCKEKGSSIPAQERIQWVKENFSTSA